jgi:outer membrane receptor for ferrienterochelin and colicins
VPSQALNTFGAFAQYNYAVRNRWNYQLGMRVDKQMQYGVFVLPSAAVLYNWTHEFSSRLNFGLGYKVPDIFDYANLGLDGQKIVLAAGIKSEKSVGGNFDLSYNHAFSTGLSIKANSSVFYNSIAQPLIASSFGTNTVRWSNAARALQSNGVDNYVRIGYYGLETYFGYTYVLAKKPYDLLQQNIELTPRHRMATTVAYELEDVWRFGVEAAYTGKQYLSDGTRTKPYIFFAAMVKRNIKQVSLVLNCENLFDFRQNKFGSVVSNPGAAPTFAPLWAPIDGRNINFTLLWKW